ncbi:MAG: OsmC family peroxiredoxin, partial [Mesorhizobium sp.]
MDATGLKAMQAPLKEVYRDDTSRALITLRAKGSIDDQSI